MEGSKVSRRQFLGGTAAVVGAAMLPMVANTTVAMATPAGTFTAAAAALTPWIPLDAAAAARSGYEIYRGMNNNASYNGLLGQTG